MVCTADKESVPELISFVKAQHQALLERLELALGNVELQLFDSTEGHQDQNERSGPTAPSALSTTQPFAEGDSDAIAEDLDGLLAEAEHKIRFISRPAALTDETWGTEAQKDEIMSENSKRASDVSGCAFSSPRSQESSKNLKNMLMGSDLVLGRTSDRMARIAPYLDGTVLIFVVLNALVLIMEAQLEGENKGNQLLHGSVSPEYSRHRFVFQLLDLAFDVFFLVEFVVVFIVQQIYRHNAVVETAGMAVMALVSLVEMGMIFGDLLGASVSQEAFHTIHAVTCLRTIRCLKVLQHFRGPRFLLMACNSFLHSLFWAMIFLGIFMMSSAICLANGLFSFYASQASFDDKVFVWQLYGTTFRSWYTLYEITFSGSWPNWTRPVIEKVHPSLVVFFVAYITVIAFGLIRVITAAFLRDTLDAAASDAEQQVADQMKKKEEYARKLEEIFSAIDAHGEGLLTEEQLSEALRYPKIRAYFQTLELDVHESKALFHILDDGDGTVTLAEFISGLLRCKGQARAIDQVAAHTEIKHLDKKMNLILTMLEGMVSTASTAASETGNDSLRPSVAMTNHLAAFGQGPPVVSRTTIR